VAVDAIRSLGRAEGFEVEATEDPAAFTDANLARFSAVVFVSTTGEVLTPARRPALEQYIRSGGGFAGIHAASDGGYDWPWYGELVGSYFRRHPAIQEANIQVETTRHPSTAHLGSTWTRTDEWYDFANNPRADVTVLLNLDEASYSGGQMGDHPISWYREFDGGRTWYTGGGHTSEAFGEPDFLAHLLGGIQYAGALTPRLPGPALDRSDWQVSASSGGASAHRAIDGDLTSRYASGVVQVPGMTFDIDLGRSRTFQAVVLDLLGEYNDEPRSWEVLVSDSPSFSAAPIAVGAGTSPRTTARFEPVTARYVRIRQVGQDSRRWWSIYELNLIGDANFVVEGGAGADAPAQRVSLGS
jgi:type 1 glutamine amidotransferase